jgi:hypothetical protein
MAGLWGNIEDDEPVGLLAGLQRGIGNPMTLAGLGLLTGGGWDAARQGMAMGTGFEQMRLADQQRRQYQGLLQDPSVTGAIPAPMLKIAQMVGPSGGPEVLAKFLDPAREADLAYKKALTAKAQREAAEGPRGPDAPSSVREWEYYQALSPEQKAEFSALKRQNNILVGDQIINRTTGQPVANVGDALRQGQIAKGEGKDIADTRAGLPEAKLRLDMVTGGLDRLEQSARNLAVEPGLDSVVGGLYQAYAPNVREKSLNAQTELENLKVKISGVVLQSMRDMSKTGGAVGQVTEREWPRLENMLANLDPRQGKAKFMENLQQVVNYAQQVKAQLRAAYEADVAKAQQGGGTPPSAPPTSNGFSIRRLD